MFHTSRMELTITCFEAFLADPQRLLARVYDVNTPSLSSESWLRMSVDASPWGMGGVKWDQHWRPAEYFHAPIPPEDCELLKVQIGDSAHMPVLETMTISIAIRLWASQKKLPLQLGLMP